MSEKMREVRIAFENIRNNYVGWQDDPNFAVLEAALRTHENGGQESEAGAVAEVMGTETDMYIGVTNLNNWSRLPAGTKLYLAPPSAPAIETAAIMRAAEVCAENAYKGREDDDPNQYAVGYRDAGSNFAIAILALIPQDGRTALEEFGRKVAFAVYGQHDKLREDETFDGLRAIVTNLIGVPPLNSESVRGDGK